MYLRRKADQFLINWKNNADRKPLIVKGARQVGKTRTIRHFAEQNYENVIEINFAEEPEYKTIIAGSYSPQAIIERISLIDMSNRYPDIRFGIKLSMANIGFENQIYSFPFYCGFLLKKWRDQFFGR